MTPTSNNITCRLCDSANVSITGRPVYYEPTKVAGIQIDVSDLNLVRCRCEQCTYEFVHPPIPIERLLECYRGATAGHWQTQGVAEVRFYDKKQSLLERYTSGRRVLDFGCYDGGLLAFLGDAYDKLGIEPSTDAADLARSRGITILAPTLDELDPDGVEPVDAAFAMDIFEHLIDPLKTLQQLHRLLKPGGIVIVETGDSDTPAWRRAGGLFPYCGIVEHVGFFNKQSLTRAAEMGGFELLHFEPHPHNKITSRDRLGFIARNAAHSVLRRLDRLALPLPRRLRSKARGPVPRSRWSDHFLAVLQRRHKM